MPASQELASPIHFSDIVKVEYTPADKDAFEKALVAGETKIIVHLKNGETVDATKPIRITYLNDKLVYLKIPNPCNHKPEIAYIEAANAKLAGLLLAPKGILVPQYHVIELVCQSPIDDLHSTPCCLIDSLTDFKPFSHLDELNADTNQVRVDRLTPSQQNDRSRQLKILFSTEFASLCVVNKFLCSNDPHQENFGTAKDRMGIERLAAIDWDMGPMPYLIDKRLLGPSYVSDFTSEYHYHCDKDGRFTPMSIDLSIFPEVAGGHQSPDNWVTNWCGNFNKGLAASANADDFRAGVKHMFYYITTLDSGYLHDQIMLIIPPQVTPEKPTILLQSLVSYFNDYRLKFGEFLAKEPINSGHQSDSASRPDASTPLRASFSQYSFHAPSPHAQSPHQNNGAAQNRGSPLMDVDLMAVPGNT